MRQCLQNLLFMGASPPNPRFSRLCLGGLTTLRARVFLWKLCFQTFFPNPPFKKNFSCEPPHTPFLYGSLSPKPFLWETVFPKSFFAGNPLSLFLKTSFFCGGFPHTFFMRRCLQASFLWGHRPQTPCAPPSGLCRINCSNKEFLTPHRLKPKSSALLC